MATILHRTIERIVVLYRRLRYTCKNLTVHGPSFLVRGDVHFIYRIIYLVIYVHVWLIAIATIIRYYDHYQQNTIRFTTRTDYLDWNTTFPSITVCEIANVDKISSVKQNYVGTNARFIEDIAFFTGTCYSCLSLCDNKTMCSNEHYTTITSGFHSPCKYLFLNCKWNDEPINCCKHFQPIQTEYGLCFSINNRHAPDTESLYVASSKTKEVGTLEFVTTQDCEAFLHSSEDVPFWNMEYDRRITVIYGSEATVIFTITDVVNEPEVVLTDPEVRRCRLTDEVPENFLAYDEYSYSTCIIQCRIETQLKLCNCTHHLSPATYKDRYCDLEGLKCLTRNYNSLRKLKVPGTNENGLECDCLPSCSEPDYNVVAIKLNEPRKNLEAGSALFMLGNRPYQRITRQVARTKLDLVVAMGNCFGLCFGGSLLSIAEVVYYICFKRWKNTKGK